MSCKATQDGQVMMESSDKVWSTEEGNGKLQYSCQYSYDHYTYTVGKNPLEEME